MSKKAQSKVRWWNDIRLWRGFTAVALVLSTVLIILLAAAMQDLFEISRRQSDIVSIDDWITFSDTALGVEFMYPRDWYINTNTNLDSSYEDPDIPKGRIPDIAEFKVEVTDGATNLQFVHFFGDLPANTTQFPTNIRDYEIIDGRVVRYMSADKDKWYYVDIVDCEKEEIEILPELGGNLCTGDYYSGFVPGPSRVLLSGRVNRQILQTVDKIVLSGMPTLKI